IIHIIPEVPIVPVDPIVAPKVGTLSVVLPIRVLDLVDYLSSSNSDPSEDYLPPVPDLPLVSPFLCSGDSEIDGESEPAKQRLERHESLTLSSEFPLVPVVAPPEIQSSLGSSSKRSLDSSSPSFGPSRKRRRSPTASVPSPTHVSRSIAPNHADLLPPRKSDGVVAHPEDSVGIRVEIAASDVREDDEKFEAEASAADTREIVVDPLVIGDSSESSRGGIPDLEDTIYDIVHYMSEMVASGKRASLVERIGSLRLEYLNVRAMLSIKRDRIDSLHWHMALLQEEFRKDRNDTRRRLRRLESIMTITRSGMNPEAIEELINQRVDKALPAYEATRAANALEVENQSQNGSDGDNGNTIMEMVRMEMEIQTRMVECTNLVHKRTIGVEDAFSMSWRELMKLMTEVYCPRNEV
ncbi:hypothetical protein Tco_1095131, partial [Tanacetum coccineum]